ncbi:hypothetical protein [Bacillus sp. Bos-x628]|uniref:hypothetical protein n=1 Tax=Bacillus maqinnsis TaxID=3229854 RepID=UPI00338EDEDD
MNVENPMIRYKEKEPEIVGECSDCSGSLAEDETFLKSADGDLFCDIDCLCNYFGVFEVEGTEV